jgi:hypothetical protein
MNEFFAGALSGLTQNIVGHPFDTAKVYLQNNKPLHNLRPIQYYRGFIYPTAFSIINNAFLLYKVFDNYFAGGLAVETKPNFGTLSVTMHVFIAKSRKSSFFQPSVANGDEHIPNVGNGPIVFHSSERKQGNTTS